jgi:ATP-dependent Clp protease ATP-binding subunit ClpA
MFERFTTRARRVVVLSQEEAARLKHSYIGTEHILLGLLGQPEGIAGQALASLGFSLEICRRDAAELAPPGSAEPAGHIPFTPRAKKTLELSLREALQLNHNFIGTEHLLLGLIREGERAGKDEGIGVKLLRRHAELPTIRAAVLSLLPPAAGAKDPMRRWVQARPASLTDLGLPGEVGFEPAARQPGLSATPAADATLSEATRLAGQQPVGSHHLLLAALGDPESAAARALTVLGVNLDHAREALADMDVTGTSDELPEEAGRRQLLIRVSDDKLTLEAADAALVKAGHEALAALGDQARPAGTIRGDLAASVSLSRAWQSLFESLDDIKRRATSAATAPAAPADPPAGPPAGAAAGDPAPPGSEAAG